MRSKTKSIIISSLIFIGIFLALSPVILVDNYIRQDDLMWEIWPGMKISDFGYLYYNTVFQLVRPICMVSFYMTDLISINIHDAVYVRLMCIILIGLSGIMLYFWQLLFNSNKLIAAIFAVCVFTLPPYQIFAATGNYSLIITALVMTFGAAFYWYYANQTSNLARRKKRYYIGCGLFFASLLDYPLSSMFIWALLTICYLNTLDLKATLRDSKLAFLKKTAITTIGLMVLYFVFSRLFHFIFHVNLSNGRTATVDTAHLIPRLFRIFDVLGWHSNFWLWNNPDALLNSYIPLITAVLALALLTKNYQNGISNLKRACILSAKSIALIFILFFLSYAPIMATNELIITFRYALVTMPILLYCVLWATMQLINFIYSINRPIGIFTKISSYMLMLAITVFGMGYANLMLADGIVGPHENDFAFIQNELTNKVIPLLKNNQKVLIHAIACDDGVNRYTPDIPTSFEYGMRTCQYQQQVIGVIIHSLYKMGYPSNFNAHNNVIYSENEIAVKDTPWGTLVVNSPANANLNNKLYNEHHYKVVTIDTRNITPYKRSDFYKNLIRKYNNA